MKYGLTAHDKYPYYKGNDCTNFISQCLQAGGFQNHFHKTHPWYCVGMKTSICWAVAASLYWYILTCTKENKVGIKAFTTTIQGDENYNSTLAASLQIGDVIQYLNFSNRIQHTAMITGFIDLDGLKHPLVSQHTYGAVNITWKKGFKKTIFHHIIDK